jgi:hypothetical protein
VVVSVLGVGSFFERKVVGQSDCDWVQFGRGLVDPYCEEKPGFAAVDLKRVQCCFRV